MNFLTDKVRKYQEKKLNEALQKLRFHQDIKKQIETRLKTIPDESKNDLKKEIAKQNEFIDIWTDNITKIKKELVKLQK